MRELSLISIIAAIVMILALPSFAQNQETEVQRSARPASVGATADTSPHPACFSRIRN